MTTQHYSNRATIEGDSIRTIVLTRPEGQNKVLQVELERIAHRIYISPWLKITLNPESEREIVWRASLARWKNQGCAVFVSASAVKGALPACFEWPEGVWALATGEGTANVLRECGVPEQWIRYPTYRLDSEGLFSEHLECFQAGYSVIIFRGQVGRSWLGEQAILRGCRVEYQTVYQRIANIAAAEWMNQWYLSGHAIDVLVLTNSEAIREVGQHVLPQIWQTATIFVPHERIQEAAHRQGAVKVILTDGGDAGLIHGLKEWLV
jgi:uroporphyrinogen-III synthase